MITAIAALGVCSQSVRAALVYDNTTTRVPARYGSISGAEFGDEIILSSGATTITNFSIEYFGTNFNGDETLRVRIYAMNGPTNGFSNNSATPGTTLFDSGAFNVTQTAGATLLFDSVNFAVPGQIAWTVEFGNVVAPELGGLNVYNPPTVGNNFDDFWVKDAGSSWGLHSFTNGTPANFGARFEAVPEPGTFQLGLVAGLVLLGGALYRRRAVTA